MLTLYQSRSVISEMQGCASIDYEQPSCQVNLPEVETCNSFRTGERLRCLVGFEVVYVDFVYKAMGGEEAQDSVHECFFCTSLCSNILTANVVARLQ